MAVREVFASKISGGQIELPGGATVDIERFELLFPIGTNVYADFMAVDGEEMGYRPLFDECLAEGVLV